MTLYKFYVFTEVVRDMNLHTTAERLFMSQQCLSRHIKQMEEHYGVKLFHRTPRLSLTENGEYFLKEAKLILESEERMKMYFGTDGGAVSGMLRIACSLARSRTYMPEVVSEFNSLYPAVSVSFVNENSFRGRNVFQENGADIVVGHAPEGIPGIFTRPLFEVDGCFIIADRLLSSALCDQANEFISEAKNGVELSQFPEDIPIALTAAQSGRSWVLDTLPEIRQRTYLLVNPTDVKRMIDICTNGRAMMLLSRTFIDYLSKAYPSFLDNIYVFPHHVNGRSWTFMETYSYDPNKPHPKYFYDFIALLEKLTQKE